MNIPVDLLCRIINKSEECRDYLTTMYPYEYEIWQRFSRRNGNHCEFARASIRKIFIEELNKHKDNTEEFIKSILDETWGSKN